MRDHVFVSVQCVSMYVCMYVDVCMLANPEGQEADGTIAAVERNAGKHLRTAKVILLLHLVTRADS